MNNFTKESGRAYWHSITNLMCCSPGFRMLQNNGRKAAMLIMLFVMGAGATFAQTPVEGCMHEIPLSGPAQATAIATAREFIDLTGCGVLPYNDQIHYIATQGGTFLVGDKPGVPGDYFPEGVSDQYSGFEKDSNHCNWVYYYVYDLKCNNDIKRITIKYTGGDHTLPVLKDKKNNPWPKDQKGLNLCYDDRPIAPSAATIAGLFIDNCDHIKVTEMVSKRTRSKNDDCGWIEINTYTIGDYCGAFEMSITYSGSDQTNPWFVSTPADLVGNNAVYCDQIPLAPQLIWADNCASGGKVSAEIDQNEFDCAGGYILRTWKISDDCGLTAEYTQKIEVRASKPVKFDETPLVVEVPCADRADYADYFPRELRYSNAHNYVDYPNPPTDEADFHCQIEGYAKATYDLPDLSLSCSEFLVTYYFSDETELYPGCTKITKTVLVKIVDKIMPTITKATDPLTVECDGSGNQAQFAEWLATAGGATAQDNCDNDLTWTNDYDNRPLEGGCNEFTGSIFVTFTVKDDCGNQVKTGNIFRIRDTKSPVMTDVIPVRAVCDGEGNSSQYMNWLAEMGGTTASDDCDNKLTLWHDGPVLAPKYEQPKGVWHDAETLADYPNRFVGGCSEFTGVVTVTFYAKDDCGNTSSKTGTFSIEDSIDPIVTPAADLTLECDGSIPLFDIGFDAEGEDETQYHTTTNFYKYIMWLRNRGGATAEDGCSKVKWSKKTIDFQYGGCAFIHTVEWTATDECGNSNSTTATFKVEDTMTPVITQEALDFEVECGRNRPEDGDGIYTPFQMWLNNNGGATAYDKCDKHLTWTHDGYDRKLSDECGNTGAFTVLFTVTDECGWYSTTSAEYRVVDNTAPYLEELDQVDLIAGDDCLADINPGTYGDPGQTGYPQSNDTCGNVVVTYSDYSDKNGPKPDACLETITRTWKSTDECGNVTERIQIITIEDKTAPKLVGNPNTLNKSNVDACEAPAGPSLAEVAALFHDNCYSPIVTLVNTNVFTDDICGWSTSFEYTVEDRCGNMYLNGGFFKVIYFGRDQTKPVLDGTKPAGKDGLNMCYQDAVDANPGVMDLIGLAKEFKDDCDTAALRVVKTFVDTRDFDKYGDDCIWSFHYNYKVYDRCGNFYEFNQEYSGEDKQAPRLNAGVDLNALNISNWDSCKDEAPAGPTTAQIALLFTECGLSPNGVIVNGKDGGDNTPAVGYDIGAGDCNWMFMYEYTITDKCGNVAPESPLKVFISGRDQTAPVLNVPNKTYQSWFSVRGICPADATIGLTVGQVLAPSEGFVFAGWPVSFDYAQASDNCTAYNDIKFRILSITPGGDSCEKTFTVTYEAEDICGNKTAVYTKTYATKDNIAPTASNPADIVVQCADDVPAPDATVVIDEADNCQVPTVMWVEDTTDGGFPIELITRTYRVSDGCGNSIDVTQSIKVEDTIAPEVECPGDIVVDADGVAFEFVGSFLPQDGPYWVTNPDVYTGQEAAALIFGGVPGDYVLSTSNDINGITNTNWVSTYGSPCFVASHGYERDGNGNSVYDWDYGNNLGDVSAYVRDWCLDPTHINYVFKALAPGAVVNYTAPTSYSDNCDPNPVVTLDAGLASGSRFPVGDTVVRYKVVDASGNDATCTFTVTVNPAPAGPVGAAPDNGGDLEPVSLNFKAYPVPFNQDVTIAYNFKFDTEVTVEVYDTKGLLVMSKKAAYRAGGDATMPLRINGSDQMYYVKLITNQGTVTKKILASKL